MIAFWWLIAFKNPVGTEPLSFDYELIENQIPIKEPLCCNSLFTLALNRDEIKLALDGDVSMMGKLISKWDLEAEILEYQGVDHVKRLDRQDFLRSQIITKTLQFGDSHTINELRMLQRQHIVVDSTGHPLNLTIHYNKFLPQTYLAAGVLISLLDPHQIVALPKGFRKQESIYPVEFTKKILLDIDSFQSEKIYLSSPDLAIVAQYYSHPSTLQTLKSQGIEMFCMGNISDIDDVKKSINDLGQICNRPLKSDLLNLFIEAALSAIDNKRLIANTDIDLNDVLIVNHHTQYSLPASKTLTYSLMKRMGIRINPSMIDDSSIDHEWAIPLREEKIIGMNPKHLLIITSPHKASLDYFYQTELFNHIDASKKRCVTILDVQLQQSPSQYIVLAYYDLNAALVNLNAN